jgi:SAM-dependent methyltransferase
MSSVVSSEARSAWAESAGVETLRRMVSVDRYNQWIFQRLASFTGERILEVGCGIGNMTPFFLQHAESLTCIDMQPESVAVLTAEFGSDSRIRALTADIADPRTPDLVGYQAYDTAVCINVLEHIEDDAGALDNMREALASDGRLLLFVPAGQSLFGRLDEAVGHFRRYSAEGLRRLVSEHGFDIAELFHMNVAGIPGWFVSGKILRRDVPPRGLLRAFNWLTPALIRAEQALKPRFGLSLVCVARRRG